VYRLRDRRHHEVLEYAKDFPEEAAGSLLETWQRKRRTGANKRRRPDFPPDFVSGSIPAWKASSVACCVAKGAAMRRAATIRDQRAARTSSTTTSKPGSTWDRARSPALSVTRSA